MRVCAQNSCVEEEPLRDGEQHAGEVHPYSSLVLEVERWARQQKDLARVVR